MSQQLKSVINILLRADSLGCRRARAQKHSEAWLCVVAPPSGPDVTLHPGLATTAGDVVPDAGVCVTHVISFVVWFDQRVFGSFEVEQRTFQTCLLAVVLDSSSLSLFLVCILSSTRPPLCLFYLGLLGFTIIVWIIGVFKWGTCVIEGRWKKQHISCYFVDITGGTSGIKTLEISTKVMTKGFSLILSINHIVAYYQRLLVDTSYLILTIFIYSQKVSRCTCASSQSFLLTHFNSHSFSLRFADLTGCESHLMSIKDM